MGKFIIVVLLANVLFAEQLYLDEQQKIKQYLEANQNATNAFKSIANKYKIKKSYEPSLQRGKFEYKFDKNAIIRKSGGGGVATPMTDMTLTLTKMLDLDFLVFV